MCKIIYIYIYMYIEAHGCSPGHINMKTCCSMLCDTKYIQLCVLPMYAASHTGCT